MSSDATIEIAILPAAVMAAIKRVLVVAYRVPWDLTPEDAGRLEGQSAEMIAEAVVKELAGGTIESKEAAGLVTFISTVLGQDLRPLDRDTWANVLGQTRQRLLAAQEQLGLVEKGRDATFEALATERARNAELKALLGRCSPIIETSDAFGSRVIAREVRQAAG